MPTPGDEEYQRRFIDGKAPTEDYRSAYRTFELDNATQRFADLWAEGKDALAVGCASHASKLWDAEYLTQTLQNLARERAAAPPDIEIVWPVPGCPEADEAEGWKGWYE